MPISGKVLLAVERLHIILHIADTINTHATGTWHILQTKPAGLVLAMCSLCEWGEKQRTRKACPRCLLLYCQAEMQTECNQISTFFS